MTFGELNKTVPEEAVQQEGTNWEPFDWTSETYQYMCRVYRGTLGIVNPQNFESKYYTASEHLYWKNLYALRGYGPYEGKYRFNGKPIVVQVIPDPPEAWQQEWMKMRGQALRDVPDGTGPKRVISPGQEAKCKEFLARLEKAAIKEGTEIVAISDPGLLSEFQTWLAEQDLHLTDEAAQLLRDSWTRIFEEERKAELAELDWSADEYREAEF